jgi:hypothetical protein
MQLGATVRGIRFELARSSGVTDGDRTRDNRSHNPVLYQLSYSHRIRGRGI